MKNLEYQIGRFFSYGMKRGHFTKAMYEFLSTQCGFIAHFDRKGFYGARFYDLDGLIYTLRVLVELKSDASESGYVKSRLSAEAKHFLTRSPKLAKLVYEEAA